MRFSNREPGVGIGFSLALCGLLMVSGAQAELQDQGDGTVLDTTTNLMWLKDANAFVTQYQADNSIIEGIVARAPALADPIDPSGLHVWNKDATLTSLYADFVNPNGSSGSAAVDGGMTWYGAMAWVSWLNSQNYLGYSDWRLPTVKPVSTAGFNYNDSCDGSTDAAHYIVSVNNELSNLYYAALNNVADVQKSDCSTPTSDDPNQFGLVNTGPFLNFKKTNYWAGTEFEDPTQAPGQAWTFSMVQGFAGPGDKAFGFGHALPVRGVASGPSPSPSPTPGSPSGYAVASNASCQQVDKQGRKVRLTLVAENKGSKKRPAGKLQITVTRDGKTYKLKRRNLVLKPGSRKTLKIVWRAKGSGDVSFNANLSDTTAAATCSVNNKP